jgi:hypothetical protein
VDDDLVIAQALIGAIIKIEDSWYENGQSVTSTDYFYVSSIRDEDLILLNIDGTTREYPTALADQLSVATDLDVRIKLDELRIERDRLAAQYSTFAMYTNTLANA